MKYIFLIFFSGCVGLNKVDVPICKELLPTVGYCTWTISKRSMLVDDKNKLFGKTWWQLKIYNLSVPPESWQPIKAEFSKMCAKYQDDCQSQGADESVQRIDEVLNATAERILNGK